MASSVADYPEYVTSIKRAVDDPIFYSTFRKDRYVHSVFEHVNLEQAWRYLIEIQKSNVPADLFDVYDLSRFHKLNDQVGGPEIHHFGGIGPMCPTTMRYIYHMCDIIQKCGVEKLREAVIVEIGAGYGGLCRLIRHIFPRCEYHIVDLAPNTQLVQKFNDNDPHIHVHPYEEFSPGTHPLLSRIDLVISNFSWCECNAFVRKLYMDQILQHAKQGYMILNTFLSMSEMEETARRLGGQLLDEVPDTNNGQNRLLVWSKS